jgi:hypothetical protein
MSLIDVVLYTDSGPIKPGKFRRPLKMEDIVDVFVRKGVLWCPNLSSHALILSLEAIHGLPPWFPDAQKFIYG